MATVKEAHNAQEHRPMATAAAPQHETLLQTTFALCENADEILSRLLMLREYLLGMENPAEKVDTPQADSVQGRVEYSTYKQQEILAVVNELTRAVLG